MANSNVVKETSTDIAHQPDRNGAGQQDAEPVVQIALEMAKVAIGSPINDLRNLTRKLFPRTRQEAEDFQKILLRLKLASEAVAGYGSEHIAGMQNPR